MGRPSPPPAAWVPPPWGLSALEDQQLGGLVMWIPPGVIYLAATLALLAVGLGLAARGGERYPTGLRIVPAGAVSSIGPQPER